jgi:hypothetical protein
MYTTEQVSQLHEKMTRERATLLDVACSLTPDQARRGNPDRMDGEEGWSPLQQLHHLWAAEMMYRQWALAAAEGRNPDFATMPYTEPAVDFDDVHNHSVDEVLAQLVAEREKTLEAIKDLSVDQYARTGRHPIWGDISVMQLLRSYYRHDRMHRMQIQGVEPDYQPSGRAANTNQKIVRRNLPSSAIRNMTFAEYTEAARRWDPNH